MSILKLAYLNVIRRKSQSLLTGIITCLTILSFVLVFSIFFIIQDGLSLTNERLGADILVIPMGANFDPSETLFTGATQKVYMDKEIEFELNKIDGIEEVTPQFFTATIEDSGCCSYENTLRIVGIDQNSDFLLKPWFNEYNINPLGDDEVIIGSDIQVILGNKVGILGDVFTVTGTLYNTGSGMDNTIFMNIDKARSCAEESFSSDLWDGHLPSDLISSVLVKVSPDSTIDHVLENITSADLQVKAISISSSITDIRNQIVSISYIILSLWLGLLIISILALVGRFNSLAKSRKKEIGYLRAMGIKKSEVFKLTILEAWIIAGISGFIGSVLGSLLVNPTMSVLKKSFIAPEGRWSFSVAIVNVFIGLLVSLLLGFLASIYPAWKSSSLEPQEVISKGDI